MFKALLLEKDDAGFRAELASLDDAALKAATPDADVLVAVEASTLNYKDGLAITNRGPVVRRWRRSARGWSTWRRRRWPPSSSKASTSGCRNATPQRCRRPRHRPPPRRAGGHA